MNDTTVRVEQSGDEWVAHLGGGDQQRYPTKEQAEAVTNAHLVFTDPKAKVGVIRAAISQLQNCGLGDLGYAKRLQKRLASAPKEESW